MITRCCAALFFTLTPLGLCQTTADASDELTSGNEISLKLIMSDQDWLGRQPLNAYWGDRGEHFYYSRKRSGVALNDLYRANARDQNEAIRVMPDHAAKESVDGGVWRYHLESQTYVEKVYVREGDLYHRDLSNGHITQLTRTTTREGQPCF